MSIQTDPSLAPQSKAELVRRLEENVTRLYIPNSKPDKAEEPEESYEDYYSRIMATFKQQNE